MPVAGRVEDRRGQHRWPDYPQPQRYSTSQQGNCTNRCCRTQDHDRQGHTDRTSHTRGTARTRAGPSTARRRAFAGYQDSTAFRRTGAHRTSGRDLRSAAEPEARKGFDSFRQPDGELSRHRRKALRRGRPNEGAHPEPPVGGIGGEHPAACRWQDELRSPVRAGAGRNRLADGARTRVDRPPAQARIAGRPWTRGRSHPIARGSARPHDRHRSCRQRDRTPHAARACAARPRSSRGSRRSRSTNSSICSSGAISTSARW